MFENPAVDAIGSSEFGAFDTSFVGELRLVAGDIGVVEVKASKAETLIVYEAADGLAELSDQNVSLTFVSLSGATKFSSVLQQILIWSVIR